MLRTAFLGGLRDAARWRLLLPIYLFGLVLGVVQAWPIFVAGMPGGLTNPYLDQLTSGNTDALVNLFMASPTAAQTSGAWGGTLLIFTSLFAICYNGFAGGLLSAWAGRRTFWGGFWSFFLPFTGLSILLVLLAVTAVVVAALLGGLIGGVGVAALAALLLQLLNTLGEYARAHAIVHERRNPFALFGLAMSFCVRHPGTLLLALAGVALHVALFAGLYAVAQALGGSPAAIIVQQALVLGWLWIKALRLGWALQYVQAANAPHATLPAAAWNEPQVTIG